jgi:hypothetical protein
LNLRFVWQPIEEENTMKKTAFGNGSGRNEHG